MRYLLLTLADWLEWRSRIAAARSEGLSAYVAAYDTAMSTGPDPSRSDRTISAVVYGLCLVALSLGVLWVRG